ncbi:MAG: DUF2798 domain-containing protein [Clostridia bacterium]|nr:DUF2798 domain-containing protein [Clostridia bacterium]
MPKSKRESFIFTLMMCSFMVMTMSMYTVGRISGLQDDFIIQVFKGFPLGFCVALAADWFLVGPLAKKIASGILTKDDKPLKKALVISTFMASGMVVVMSLFGAVMAVGLSDQTVIQWFINIPLNYMVALPIQLLIAGPIVRYFFGQLYPA